MTYSNEHELVSDFITQLSVEGTPWGSLDIVREFSYQRGRVDLVGVSSEGDVFAFEAKLIRWRDALQQAYRNTCFAHRSYVILPWNVAQLAHRYVAEFERRRVGLCTVYDGKLLVLHDARPSEPLQRWLTDAASIQASGRPSANVATES